MKRRRFLAIVATAAAMSGMPWPDSPARRYNASGRRIWRWRGSALGAEASMQIAHDNEANARRILFDLAREIDRLEDIFSLYRTHSALSRLNRAGRLENPPMELIELLDRASGISETTAGTFDCTIQPLWQLHARHLAAQPEERALDRARALVNYRNVDISSREIRFARPGMAVTLNGIAQGYITDQISDRLMVHGLNDILVNMGEIRAHGLRADGRPWKVGIDRTETVCNLRNAAIATSSPDGTLFAAIPGRHHLIDPQTGHPARQNTQISIIAGNATLADAVSTACAILDPASRAKLTARLQLECVETALANT